MARTAAAAWKKLCFDTTTPICGRWIVGEPAGPDKLDACRSTGPSSLSRERYLGDVAERNRARRPRQGRAAAEAAHRDERDLHQVDGVLRPELLVQLGQVQCFQLPAARLAEAAFAQLVSHALVVHGHQALR